MYTDLFNLYLGLFIFKPFILRYKHALQLAIKVLYIS